MKTVDKYQFNEEQGKFDSGSNCLFTQSSASLPTTPSSRNISHSKESASTKTQTKDSTII